MKHIAKIVVSVGLVLMLLAPNVGAVGLAVSPPEFTIHDALRGGEFEQTITVFNTDSKTAKFALNATGDIRDWISLYEIDEEKPINAIEVPGKGSKKIVVRFSVPSDAASGNYTSTIKVQTIPKEIEKTAGAAAVAGVIMSIEATIVVTGTQILTGEVKGITASDIEVEYPLRIKVDFRNTGNVIAKPEIKVAITKNGALIDSFVYSETAIKPKSRETIPVEWDTTGREVGDYIANVSVSLGEEVLAEKDLSFKILARGTLTSKGELVELSYDGQLGVGIFIKILAEFENTGEIDSDAQFKGEVYIDGNFAGVLESDELTVPAKEKATLTSYLELDNPGDYTVKGHVIYSGKKTATKETSFNVPVTGEGAAQKRSIPGFESGLAIAGLLAVAVAYLRIRRRK